MFSKSKYLSSKKEDELIKTPKLIKSSKILSNKYLLNRRFCNIKSMDMTSRLGQFAWRQIIPSNILLPVLFR